MNKTYHPQPYFKLPTLKPLGNYVETRYGRRQRRLEIQTGVYTIPVGLTEIFMSGTPAFDGFTHMWLLSGKLKENQVFVPITSCVFVGNQVRSPTPPSGILNILDAELNLSVQGNTMRTYPFTNFAVNSLLNGYGAMVEVHIPPIRWDECGVIGFNSVFGLQNTTINPLIFPQAGFEIHTNISNLSAAPITALLQISILYDIMTLEEFLYGEAA